MQPLLKVMQKSGSSYLDMDACSECLSDFAHIIPDLRKDTCTDLFIWIRGITTGELGGDNWKVAADPNGSLPLQWLGWGLVFAAEYTILFSCSFKQASNDMFSDVAIAQTLSFQILFPLKNGMLISVYCQASKIL